MSLSNLNIMKKNQRIWLTLFLLFFTAQAFSWINKTPLPTEQAFKFSAVAKSKNEVVANWEIAPDFYLYKDKIHFSATPQATVSAQYPTPELKPRVVGKGNHEVYSGNLSIPVKINTAAQTIEFTAMYQGCSAKGFCYPPVKKTVSLNLAAANSADEDGIPDVSVLLTNQSKVQSILSTQHMAVTLLLFLGMGLLLAFTPCVLPMVPILTGIIIGQQHPVGTKKALMLSIMYVLGSAIMYSCAGVLAAAMGSSLQVWLQKPIIITAVSALFVLLALSLFGFYNLQLSSQLQNRIVFLSNKQKGGSYVGVFFMGLLSTLIVSPCVTAPLVGILIYISQTGNMLFGASALFVLGIGMGIPLILIGTSAGKWLPKRGPWLEAVKKSCGFLMLGMAIWLLSRVVSPQVTMIGYGALLLSIALFLGVYLPRLLGKPKLHLSLGGLVGFSGLVVIFAAAGIANPLTQWIQVVENKAEFVVIRDIKEFKRELSKARAMQRPVILDFYADWCESCVAMDKKVFNSPTVKEKINHYLLLRADLSENTSNDEALLKKFNVIAPPTILFFDTKGKEIDSRRIVGEVNAKEFIARVE